MADEKQVALAKEVYNTLCKSIDNNNWKYERDDENLTVTFAVSGDDIPMRFVLLVDTDRQLVRLLSPLPFKMSEGKRMEGAIATCIVSNRMVDGSFDYDIGSGAIVFRMTACFRGSVVGANLFNYLIACSCAMVDEYNDKFLALEKGLIEVTDFIKTEN